MTERDIQISNLQKQEKFRLTENLFPGKVDQNEDFFTLKLKKISESEDAIEKVAELISQNEVIATAYGDIETGPRALGHRSMICNAHSEETIQFQNTVIKSRSKFRPTAPVILESNAKRYLHTKVACLVTRVDRADVPAV